ncbi:hypothetical protein [Wolbachia endosymbiont of Litomosoides brasiliensis]|uniref:hypothetical protein n=1 Tax=Wolbachia endosymbiont of Litomosoides brasiliensis TaxID=1812117 RepID=UPI001FE2D040|nr:hypothetical protein [Wolbachia endosymbiont of Litomosoides brasiliensis]
MGVKILPVVLHCNSKELVERIQSEDRHQGNKITDPDFAIKKIEEKRLFIPKGAFEINNSELSAKGVAKKIADKIKNGKRLVETSVTNNLTTGHTCG